MRINMIDYLIERPAIGVVCGVGSGATSWLMDVLTDDTTAKMVSHAGIFMATSITAITFIGVMIKFIKQIYIEIRSLKRVIKEQNEPDKKSEF